MLLDRLMLRDRLILRGRLGRRHQGEDSLVSMSSTLDSVLSPMWLNKRNC